MTKFVARHAWLLAAAAVALPVLQLLQLEAAVAEAADAALHQASRLAAQPAALRMAAMAHVMLDAMQKRRDRCLPLDEGRFETKQLD